MAASPVDDRLTAAQVRLYLTYEPETGFLRWLPRPEHLKYWNTRNAGRVAGTPTKPKGYVQLAVQGNLLLAHRVAWVWMTSEWPTEQVDHINGVRDDNRWLNLRAASAGENRRNQTTRRDNTSGFKGVSRDKHGRKWAADIWVDGRKHYLGLFDTAELAHAAYCEAAARLHGEFARTA